MYEYRGFTFRIYPTLDQEDLLNRTIGCCRFLYNIALEQRSTFWRKGRKISFTTWSRELRLLKDEAPFLRDVPHHCLLQALKDLDAAYARFFSGQCGYPRQKKRRDRQSCRFPDAKQFSVTTAGLKLPKLGLVAMKQHRPLPGRPKSITLARDGTHWTATVLVAIRVSKSRRIAWADAASRARVEGGIDLGVAQPVTTSDGVVLHVPRVTARQAERERRLRRQIARRQIGSNRRRDAARRLGNHLAQRARRRQARAHQISAWLVKTYTHLGVEDLDLRSLTRSAAGTVDAPGKNVAQKRGLNRALADVAPWRIRALTELKARDSATTVTRVISRRTSQDCSACEEHPADDPATQHLAHGRVSRDLFACPLCGHTENADRNAAKNIRNRARVIWRAVGENVATTVGPAAAGRGDLRGRGRQSRARRVGEPSKKIRGDSGLPRMALSGSPG